MDETFVWCASLSGCLIQHCSFVSDDAFLAREKARADAEYYSSAKIAEANKVKAVLKCIPPHLN